ncbi:penicillin-binding protein 2 [Tepidiforma sp.]|uniref:penicillin-binding protein 2 n=1 Tax=Tepidiforma sp. TaxID=2682230 RepID=UPI002ADDA23B|nr:penicillin-binding protein 2 [Tepidiforma sp.]
MSMLEDGIRTPAGPSRNRPHGNVAVLRGFVLLLFAILTIRLADMQILRGEEFARRSRENHIVRTNILPTRGLITDRNGEPLVRNVGVYSATVLPEMLPGSADARYRIYLRLQELIGVSPLEVQTKVDEAIAAGRDYIAIRIATNLPREAALALEEAAVDLPGVSLEVTPGREYIAGPAFSHILGYIGPQTAEEAKSLAGKGYQLNEPVGKDGIEAWYEGDLRGQIGYTAAEQNAQGRLIRLLGRQDPVPGNTLRLNLDAGLQAYVADLLERSMADNGTGWGDATQAAAVVMNAKTGQVYALVSIPTYDNNIYSDAERRAAELQRIQNDTTTYTLLNKALNPAAPGSTFKLVTATAGLAEGSISPNTTFQIGCSLDIKGENDVIYNYPDWRCHNMSMDVRTAIAWSSNVFFFLTSGGDLERQRGLGGDVETSGAVLAAWARKFGFGKPTGIDLFGEAAGRIPDPQWKRRTKVGAGFAPGENEWFLGDTYNTAIGQGDVLATPLQVARMTAAIANGGTLPVPHVADAVVGPDGKVVRTIAPEGERVDVDPRWLQVVREGMLGSVQYGAGARAASSRTTVAGKTGTAEFFTRDGKKSQHAWFTGFAPYNDPEVVVTVYFDIGVGGDKAAPVAGKIFDYFMEHVRP